MARRICLAAAIAGLAVLNASTAACTSSLLSPLSSLHIAPSSSSDTDLVPPPARISRRSPSPSPQGAGITLGDPTDTSTTASTSNSTSSTSALPVGYSFPQPFDAVLGINFTSTSCPSFFNRFLADPEFKACAPLSLLLDSSTTFFEALQDPTTLPAVLDQICSADADTCLGVMDNYARQIDQSSTCGPDLRKGNMLAVSALNGFRNYKLYYQAGCLRSPSTQKYCLAEAANSTSPSDLYLYYLPGGTSLPSGEKATCNKCSQSLMSTFSNYASNATLRISETYINARNIISLSCGPSFAPMVAATKTADASRQIIGGGFIVSTTLIAGLVVALA